MSIFIRLTYHVRLFLVYQMHVLLLSCADTRSAKVYTTLSLLYARHLFQAEVCRWNIPNDFRNLHSILYIVHGYEGLRTECLHTAVAMKNCLLLCIV